MPSRDGGVKPRIWLPVIEDAAHALMSKYKGKYIGNNSAYTCFSFQAIKQMTTVDDVFYV
ncbi:MAG TPA: DegT/DnrJ/EryC1/StrS family aminotransferase [Metabacillus sp.]|nr:DegT/DnrJ/EryC1/StrS family aminotransferase [Metabacillus sp.]